MDVATQLATPAMAHPAVRCGSAMRIAALLVIVAVASARLVVMEVREIRHGGIMF